jgi:hypothetical protein
MPGDDLTRRLASLLTAARVALGMFLAGGALLFLLKGRADFARLQRPDAARVALCAAEFAAAGLFLFCRTALAGGVGLAVVLAWAAGFHFARGLPAGGLLLSLAAVLALSAATGALARGKA